MRLKTSVVLTFAACAAPVAHLNGPVSAQLAAKPANCDLQFVYVEPNHILYPAPPNQTTRFDEIGFLNIDNPRDKWTESMKAAVRPQACKLGAAFAVLHVESFSRHHMTLGGNALNAIVGLYGISYLPSGTTQ